MIARLALCLGLVACAAGRSAPPTAVRGPADTSLGPEQYLAREVPAWDHPWSPAELLRAAAAIERIAAADMDDLPRYHSARSGALFARLTDAAPLAVLDGVARPARRVLIHDLLAASNRILAVYLKAQAAKVVGADEVVEVAALELRVFAPGLDLLNELLDGEGRGDPGLITGRDGIFEVTVACLGMIDDSTPNIHLAVDTRARLLHDLRVSLPGIYRRFDATRQEQIASFLAGLLANSRLADLHDELEALRTATLLPS
jgi:hypothetical protein